ncbi:hypothetical protein [Paenibacillus mucilaginosus]|uniref:Uncharacterized protein n=1 Tax=Paenibacillus mucilaginosus (strain KNP414) TaxID=1036673 RepID=F8FN27_PAEMK|nr:hypothetical protein [Paenibacillus mucilaginosus]AEI45697.1 hypothetical protein KNP414_07187 [Paenibacillus mucilaginosus KNP414]MCG7215114.1 hypothetical protein [Paenibacillus mucilaginosus]WDM27087.1 hypothetical protein KCX80_32585 [Paenibacillus mucilaginosus]
MNVYKLTYLSIKGISIYFVIQSLESFWKVIGYVYQVIAHPDWGRDLTRTLLSSAGPWLTLVACSVVLWIGARKITGRLVREPDREAAMNMVGLLQLGIGLLGIYMLVLDLSGILWSFREYAGDYLGIEPYAGQYGILLDFIVHVTNIAVSLFLIFRAGWISRKLHGIWNREP